MKNQVEVNETVGVENVGRRKAMKAVVGGVATVAAYNLLPAKWGTPLVESVFVPAHAVMSPDGGRFSATAPWGEKIEGRLWDRARRGWVAAGNPYGPVLRGPATPARLRPANVVGMWIPNNGTPPMLISPNCRVVNGLLQVAPGGAALVTNAANPMANPAVIPTPFSAALAINANGIMSFAYNSATYSKPMGR